MAQYTKKPGDGFAHYSPRTGAYYATVDADKNLLTLLGGPAQVIVAGGAGALDVTLEDGAEITLTLAVGVPQYWSIKLLKTTGAVANKITVGV